MIRFRVRGIPAPQGSKRHVGGGRMVESSRAVGPWREAVRAEAQRALAAERDWPPDWRGWSVVILFWLPRPGYHYGTGRNAARVRESAPSWPVTRPDLDKLVRAVLDGLTDAGMWQDDSQVIAVRAAKAWAGPGCPPGALVKVSGVEEV